MTWPSFIKRRSFAALMPRSSAASPVVTYRLRTSTGLHSFGRLARSLQRPPGARSGPGWRGGDSPRSGPSLTTTHEPRRNVSRREHGVHAGRRGVVIERSLCGLDLLAQARGVPARTTFGGLEFGRRAYKMPPTPAQVSHPVSAWISASARDGRIPLVPRRPARPPERRSSCPPRARSPAARSSPPACRVPWPGHGLEPLRGWQGCL